MAYNTDSEMPSYVKELLVKMEFVGRVPPGKKIYIGSKEYVDPELWDTRPKRWLYGENAARTCQYVDNIITKISEIMFEYKNKSSIRTTLIETADIFRQGLINLIETYKDNPDAASKLRTSLKYLDIKIPENKRVPVDGTETDAVSEEPGFFE